MKILIESLKGPKGDKGDPGDSSSGPPYDDSEIKAAITKEISDRVAESSALSGRIAAVEALSSDDSAIVEAIQKEVLDRTAAVEALHVRVNSIESNGYDDSELKSQISQEILDRTAAIDSAIADLVGMAPESLDTLKEVADKLASSDSTDAEFLSSLNAEILARQSDISDVRSQIAVLQTQGYDDTAIRNQISAESQARTSEDSRLDSKIDASLAGVQSNVDSMVTTALDSQLVEQRLASALKHWPVISDTEPTETTKYGVPVLWYGKTTSLTPTPVAPTEPSWNDMDSTFTTPANVVGVDYIWEVGPSGGVGQTLTQGGKSATTGSYPRTVTVKAVAQSGYTMLSAYSWSHSFPNPNGNILLATDSFQGADTASIVDRVMDNALGGTSTIKWERCPYTAPGVYRDPLPHGVGISGNRLLVGPNNADPTENRSLMIVVGTKGMQLDFTTISYMNQASDTEYAIDIRLGAGVAAGSQSGRCALSIGKGRWGASVQDTGNLGAKLEATTGKWSVKLFGDTFTVIPPSGVTYTYSAGTAGKNGSETAIRIGTNAGTATNGQILVDDLSVRSLS